VECRRAKKHKREFTFYKRNVYEDTSHVAVQLLSH
jgi:hypothetical protein